MPIFTNFNLGKEAKKYNEKQQALRKGFVKKVNSFIRSEEFSVRDSEVAIDAFTKERNVSMANIQEALDVRDGLENES